MVQWYWYIFGMLTILFAAIGIEWLVNFWVTWPFEE